MGAKQAVGAVALVVSILGATTLGFVGTATAQSGNAPDCSTVTYSGSGSSSDPYEVSNVDQLQCMGDGDTSTSLSDDFELTSDIDASATSGWNGGKGFEPVGSSSSWFGGTFDGNDHVISDLYIDRSSEDDTGLFGLVDGGTVENVELDGGSVTGDGKVGALVGYLYDGTVTASSASTDVDGSNTNVGGLVGESFDSSITDSSASGDVEATAGNVGGLVGYAYDGKKIENSFATGDVDGNGNDDVGGLVGTIGSSVDVKQSYATGSVDGGDNVGGLVGATSGSNDPLIDSSYATGTVTGSGSNVGGLVGYLAFSDEIDASNATGSVTGTGEVGGLVGYSTGTVKRSRATGTVTGSGDRVGGLVGSNSGPVSASTATGAVDGNVETGGLVGYNYDGDITTSNATGAVDGTEAVGGLAGYNLHATVTESYATGDVTATNKLVGGLVGHNDDWGSPPTTVSKSYATGSVDGPDQVGGLVGKNGDLVTTSYAAGTVTGSSNVGGLVGTNDDTVTQAYWDTETTGQTTSDGGTGLTTVEMKGSPATGNMSGFDFTSTWAVVSTTEVSYPYLQNNKQLPEPGLQMKTNFVVDVTGTTSPVDEGRSLDVTVDVTNTGVRDATQTLTLSDFGGGQVDSASVQVDGGESETITLTWATNYVDGGTGDVTAASDDDTASQRVSIRYVNTNDPPVASNDTYTMIGNRTLTVDAPGVLRNDTDENGDGLETTVVDGPSHGSLSLARNGGFQYIPASNFTGTDSFTYRTSDYHGASDTAIARITVQQPPYYTVRLTNLSENVTRGNVTEIDAAVANTGDVRGTDPVVFSVNETVVANRTVTLNASEQVTQTFIYNTTGVDASPRIEVAVTTPDRTVDETIRIVSPTDLGGGAEQNGTVATPAQTQPETPTERSPGTPAGTPTESPTETPAGTPTEPSTGSLPETPAAGGGSGGGGIGLFVAFLASVVLTLVAGIVVGALFVLAIRLDRRGDETDSDEHHDSAPETDGTTPSSSPGRRKPTGADDD